MHDYYPWVNKLDYLENEIRNLQLELFDIQYEKKSWIRKEEDVLKRMKLAQAKVNEILPDKKEMTNE